MVSNIIKLSFLLAYLALLICITSEIPFVTAIFRSLIVLVAFVMTGFMLRSFLIKVINSAQAEAARRETAAAQETRPTPEQLEISESEKLEAARMGEVPG